MKLLIFKKIPEYAEDTFQVLFLVYTILGFNSLTFGSPVISAAMWASWLLGAGLLLCRLRNWKDYLRMPGLVCLAAMCGICAVSILLNRQYDFKTNLIYLIFWVFYFFLFFAQNPRTSMERIKRRFRLLGHILCASAFLLGVISLVMLVVRYSEVVEIRGSTVIRGFTHGRLYGAYLTPNGGAVVGSIVILLSVLFFRRCRNLWCRVFAACNALVQFLYIVFSDSRSGNLCLTLGTAVYVLFASIYSPKIRPGKGKGAVVAALVVAAAVLSFLAPGAAKNAYNGMIEAVSLRLAANSAQLSTAPEASGELPEPGMDEELKQQLLDAYQVDRGYDLSGDISNRRFDIWKSGLEIFRQRPWFGTTFRGFLPFAMEHLPDTYIVSNDYMPMDTLDNDFVNLLVSNGILGFGCFVIFVVWVLAVLFRRVFTMADKDPQIPVMMGVCMAAAVCSMFSSGVLYMQSPFSVLFWLSLGTLVRLASREGKECFHE